MRNPNRIKPFCDRLAEVWGRVPDWRFGQFICNLFSQITTDTNRDVFFIEDPEMEKFIRDYLIEELVVTKMKEDI